MTFLFRWQMHLEILVRNAFGKMFQNEKPEGGESVNPPNQNINKQTKHGSEGKPECVRLHVVDVAVNLFAEFKNSDTAG